MSDLAKFLELIHTAGSRWQTVFASGEHTIDLEAARSAAATVFGLAGFNVPLPPGMTAMPTGTERRTFRIAAVGRDRVRVEQTGDQHTVSILRPDGTATRDPEGNWSFEAAAEASLAAPALAMPRGKTGFRVGGPAGGHLAFGFISLLDSSMLLGSCRFDSADAIEFDGRTALRASARVRQTTFPFGPTTNGLHISTTRVELSVDIEAGIILRLDEFTDIGLMTSRSIHLEELDMPLDEALFSLSTEVEANKAKLGFEQFDHPRLLASSVDFGVYELNPEPTNTTTRCQRDSATHAQIIYFNGSRPIPNDRMFQPIAVSSTRPKPDNLVNASNHATLGDDWVPTEVLGKPAWIWSFEQNGQRRSHVRITFGDADVELSGELSGQEALSLAATLHRTPPTS